MSATLSAGPGLQNLFIPLQATLGPALLTQCGLGVGIEARGELSGGAGFGEVGYEGWREFLGEFLPGWITGIHCGDPKRVC